MTNYPFQPSNQGPFQFQPILDGVSYNALISWGLFGQGWYFNLYSGAGDRIVSEALVGSPTGLNIESLVWDLRGNVTAKVVDPHGYKIGSVVDLVIAGAAPAAYSGEKRAFIIGPDTFTFVQAFDPGQATNLGVVSYDIDLLANRGFTSTVVFREASQTFEVTP